MSATPAGPAGGSPRLAALVRAHQGAATLLLNLVLVLVAVNLLLAAAFALDAARVRLFASPLGPPFAADGAPNAGPGRTEYQLEWFDARAYGPPSDEPRAARVLRDFHDLAALGFAYQPWTQFAEPRFEGDLVHVDQDARGFLHRRIRNAAAPTEARTVTVFVLGGSTTFGYNVADEETWPSALAELLGRRATEAAPGVRVQVVNFGRGFYTPSQEAVLLLDLLKSGHRPHLVVFMDGVNWGPAEDVPHFTRRLETGFREMQLGRPRSGLEGLGWIPMVRLARRLSRPEAGPLPPTMGPRRVEEMAERFVASWKVAAALCDLYGVDRQFFLQPDPILNYRAALYRRPLPASFLDERAQRADFHRRLSGQTLAVDLTGLFAEWGEDRKAIVDDVHYSPAFNRFLAEQVARRIDLDALLRARPARQATPTGAVRPVYPGAPMRDEGRRQ